MDIENVHKDREPARTAGKKCGLIGLDDAHYLAVRGSQDQAVTPLPGAHRIPKEGNDPDRQDYPEDARDPEEPGVETESGEYEAHRNDPCADDEP